MSARLIRELALEALANRARLIELDRELQEMLHRHPDAALIRGLPGMGAVLTAEFIAEAGDLARFHFADALASAAGMAPVLRQSGRTRIPPKTKWRQQKKPQARILPIGFLLSRSE